ncbi:unnamed protein product [Urochloa humidicola]
MDQTVFENTDATSWCPSSWFYGENKLHCPCWSIQLTGEAVADASYEVLSVLHLMAMVCLLQANTLLLPRSYGDGYTPRVSEESRRATVDVFLKAAGYID